MKELAAGAVVAALLLLIAVFSSGCVTRKKMEQTNMQHFMMGWIHGQEGCAKDIMLYNEWLFGDRVDKAKKKELKGILRPVDPAMP